MHFEFLVEDASGKVALEILVPKIVCDSHTIKVICYKGVGRIPPGMRPEADPKRRLLLDQLPRLLRGYGATYAQYPDGCRPALFVVCDLDRRCQKSFREELLQLLASIGPRPEVFFCFAIEEGEAWLLGDIPAVKSAYKDADGSILKRYVNDAICGTWEILAEAIHRGGAGELRRSSWCAVGAQKSNWSSKIAPHMKVDANRSPSFRYFRDKLRSVAARERPAGTR